MMDKKRTVICRCEEITQEDILEAIRSGETTLDAIKKRTRAGMGFCQGRTCRRLVAQLISAYSNIPLDAASGGSIRIPVGPLSLGLIAETESGTEE